VIDCSERVAYRIDGIGCAAESNVGNVHTSPFRGHRERCTPTQGGPLAASQIRDAARHCIHHRPVWESGKQNPAFFHMFSIPETLAN
jgi:hypothetical protein